MCLKRTTWNYAMIDSTDFNIMVAKTAIIYLSVIQVVPVMVWAERRGMALMQDRPGPNRVGPFGLFQPIADFIKLLFKENSTPTNVNRLLYGLGPFLLLFPASLMVAAIRFAGVVIISD